MGPRTKSEDDTENLDGPRPTHRCHPRACREYHGSASPGPHWTTPAEPMSFSLARARPGRGVPCGAWLRHDQGSQLNVNRRMLPLVYAVEDGLQSRPAEFAMPDLSAFPITKRWPASHPDRLQLYS